jgi:hypothetical protein
MTELDNFKNPTITGYEAINKQLKVYEMMYVGGKIVKSDYNGVKIKGSGESSKGKMLFLENVIDPNTNTIVNRINNTVLELYSLKEPMKFEVTEKSTGQSPKALTSDMVTQVKSMDEMNISNKSYFPWGIVQNKYLYGRFDADIDNKGELRYQPLKREIEIPNEKPYITAGVKGIEKDGDKFFEKLNFELRVNRNKIDEVSFKYAKELFRSASPVNDLLGNLQGFVYCFENIKTKNEELIDPNFNNITIVYFDNNTKTKTIAELPFGNNLKTPFAPEKFVFDDGKLKILFMSYSTMLKGAPKLVFIDKDGKTEFIELGENSMKTYNLWSKSIDNVKKRDFVPDDYHFFEDYEIEFGTIKSEFSRGMDKSRPKISKYISLTKNGLIPLKSYTYEVSSTDEVYPIKNTRFCLIANGESESVIEILNDDIKVHDLNSKGFVRPFALKVKDNFVQDAENIYFVYENDKGEFVTVTVKK